jgi:hypothetical protein
LAAAQANIKNPRNATPATAEEKAANAVNGLVDKIKGIFKK